MSLSPSARPSVLLVDDNHDGLIARRSLLEEQGYRVQIANNGEEGLKLVQTDAFDVVVTDFKMPRMDGAELIKRIRQINPKIPVILLSGFVDPLGLTEEGTGADAVLPKSANEPAHLVRWVKRLVNRAYSRKPPVSQKRSVTRARVNVR